MSPLAFKTREGSTLFACFAEASAMYIPQDPPLVLYLPTIWWPTLQLVNSPHASALEKRLGSDSNLGITRTEDERASTFCLNLIKFEVDSTKLGTLGDC